MQQNPAATTLFSQPKPAIIRLWHWLLVLLFLASVVTVVLGSTMFRTRYNISTVQEQIQEKGGTVTPEQARAVAHEFSDKLWMLHKYIGYGLSFLLLVRIIAEVTLSKQQKLGAKIKNALNYPASAERKHYLFVNYGYLFFYTLFLLMALTGLVLAFDDIHWLKPIHKLSKQIHVIVQYGLYAYMVVHIFGVVRADMTNHAGIVSRMINGK